MFIKRNRIGLPLERSRFPKNHKLPAVYRLVAREATEPIAQDEFARDVKLAAVEAALFAADEPLNVRRLANVAGLADPGEARRLIGRLQALYEEDHSAFQLEEIA